MSLPIHQQSVQTTPTTVEAVAVRATASGLATTSIIGSIPTAQVREGVTLVSSAGSLTIVLRIKAAGRLISVDRTFAHTGGTDTLDLDADGFGDELEILATNAASTDATVTIKFIGRP
jgi:hypothetical protein